MPIDPATIARLRDLLAICDKAGNPYGPEHATLFVEARLHLPALLDAAEDTERLDWLIESEAFVVEHAQGFFVKDRDGFSQGKYYETARNAIDAARAAKEEHGEE